MQNKAGGLLLVPILYFHEVYKAIYFPTSSFLEAYIGNNPSYSWRSVLAFQELRKDARIRIGNGSSTNIWGSPWLADEEAPCILNPLPQGMVDTIVDSLKYVNGLSWDMDIDDA